MPGIRIPEFRGAACNAEPADDLFRPVLLVGDEVEVGGSVAPVNVVELGVRILAGVLEVRLNAFGEPAPSATLETPPSLEYTELVPMAVR